MWYCAYDERVRIAGSKRVSVDDVQGMLKYGFKISSRNLNRRLLGVKDVRQTE